MQYCIQVILLSISMFFELQSPYMQTASGQQEALSTTSPFLLIKDYADEKIIITRDLKAMLGIGTGKLISKEVFDQPDDKNILAYLLNAYDKLIENNPTDLNEPFIQEVFMALCEYQLTDFAINFSGKYAKYFEDSTVRNGFVNACKNGDTKLVNYIFNMLKRTPNKQENLRTCIKDALWYVSDYHQQEFTQVYTNVVKSLVYLYYDAPQEPNTGSNKELINAVLNIPPTTILPQKEFATALKKALVDRLSTGTSSVPSQSIVQNPVVAPEQLKPRGLEQPFTSHTTPLPSSASSPAVSQPKSTLRKEAVPFVPKFQQQQQPEPKKTVTLQPEPEKVETSQQQSKKLADAACIVKVQPIPVLQQKSDGIWFNEDFEKQSLIINHRYLKWPFVRESEGLNCAYHGIKNCILMMEYINNDDRGLLLTDLRYYVNRMLLDEVKFIYKSRLEEIRRQYKNIRGWHS